MSSVAAEAPIDVGGLLRRLRYPAVVITIGLALVTVLAIIGRQADTASLDPRNTAPDGAHALSVLLGERGVSVTVAATTGQLASTSSTTILISSPEKLSRDALHAVAASTSPVILIDPSLPALRAFGIAARPDAITPAAGAVNPSCTLPAAVAAGSARIAGDLYAAPAATTRCYVQQGDAALVQTARSNAAVTTILGSPSTLSNARLGDDGDAALALGLLDNQAVQFVPGALDAGPATGSHRGLINLLPSRLLWATLQVFIVLLVVALWRGRRLGAPVVEPLPVVVRAAETVEGRGRLMHAARSRGLAAQSLRAAALRRISRALRLGSGDDQAAVVGLVAERTAMPASEVQAVLYGGDPSDDASLVSLAQRLPSIETAVRQDGGQPPGGQP
jgi:hypothetical protein